MKQYRILALALTAVLFCSCQKDLDGLVDLDALIADKPSSNEKVYINSSNFACWHNNDKVNINGTEYAVSSTDATNAKISEVTKAETYTAAYPAEYVNSCNGGIVTMDIPTSQIYTEGSNGEQNIVCPMVGYSDGSTLAFHNVASLLKIAVTNSYGSALDIRCIEVSATSAVLAGSGSINGVTGQVPSFTASSSQQHQVSLFIDEGCKVMNSNSTQDYYLVVAPFTQSDYITISVVAVADNGVKYRFSQTSQSELSIARNTLAPVTITIDNTTTKNEITGLLGDGTADNPYRMMTAADLNALRQMVSQGETGNYFRLTSDLTISDVWTPIGTSTNKFSGTFDGNGHTLTLNIQPNASSFGLFGYINNATIENLTLEGDAWTGEYNNMGALCGQASGTNNITNCTNNIAITGTYSVGGLIGSVSGPTTLKGCINNAAIKATGSSGSKGVGGIIGTASSTITISKCLNTETITSTDANANIYTGGLIGYMGSSITMTDCGNTGNLVVNKGFAVAGLVGCCRGGASSITNSYSTGNISISSNPTLCGGISTSANGTKPTIANCYFSGEISGSANYGLSDILAGYDSSCKVTATNCYSLNSYRKGSYNAYANYILTQKGTPPITIKSLSMPSMRTAKAMTSGSESLSRILNGSKPPTASNKANNKPQRRR